MTDIAGSPGASSIGSPAFAPSGTTPATGSSVRNIRLQHLRGLAAVAVVLFHSADYLKQLRNDGSYFAVFSPFMGMYGVAVFFVLSGYLMSQLSLRGEPHRFLIDRVLRIYPLMLIVVAVSALAYFVTGYTRRPDLLALTLVPAGPRNYFLGIEWTLLVEVTFYVIITLAMLTGTRRHLEAVFAAWLAALIAMALLDLGPAQSGTPTILQFFAQPANAAFLFGFLMPRILEARWLPGPRALLFPALLIMPLYLVLPESGDRWVAGVSALLVVAAALKAPPVSGNSVFSRMWLRLGDASYALYLCHVPLIIISGNLLPETVSGGALWLGWSLGAIALGLAVGRLDVDLHTRLKAWSSRLRPRQLTVFSSGFIAAFLGLAVYAEIDARADAAAKATAWTAITSSEPQSWPSVLTTIDSSAVLKGGRVVLRGYAIDLSEPDGGAHVAILQDGRIIAFDRMTRMRPKIAEAASRPDITSIRFGFGVVTDAPLDCRAGPISVRVVLSNGKVAPVESDVLTAVCAGK